MTTYYYKRIITNEIVWIGQLLFPHVIFLLASEVSVAFNISSSHSNSNLSNRRFLHGQF